MFQEYLENTFSNVWILSNLHSEARILKDKYVLWPLSREKYIESFGQNVIYYWNTMQKAGYSAYISSNSNVLFRTVIITTVLKAIQWVINIFYIFIGILIPINITQTTILHYHTNIPLVLLVIIAYYSWTNTKDNFFYYIYSVTVIRVNL